MEGLWHSSCYYATSLKKIERNEQTKLNYVLKGFLEEM